MPDECGHRTDRANIPAAEPLTEDDPANVIHNPTPSML